MSEKGWREVPKPFGFIEEVFVKAVETEHKEGIFERVMIRKMDREKDDILYMVIHSLYDENRSVESLVDTIQYFKGLEKAEAYLQSRIKREGGEEG